MDSSSQLWVKFLNACLEKRLRAEQFDRYAAELYKRTPIVGSKLADNLIGRQKLLKGMVDPLLPAYADSLLESNRLSTADLLGALFKKSRYYGSSKAASANSVDGGDGPPHSPAELEYTMLDLLTKTYFMGGKRPRTQEETRIALRILSEWMIALATSDDALLHSLDQQYVLVRDSLGTLATSMLENSKVIGVVDTALPKETRKSLSRALTVFIPYWTQATLQPAESITRLEHAQKNRSLVDETQKPAAQDGSLDVAAALQVEQVLPLAELHSRPGAFVFISSLLASRPLTDESIILNYLHVKYKGDMQSLTVDLILAGFDVLASAVERNESSQVMFCLKSFLINKLPTLITALSVSMYEPLTPEYFISLALQRVDLNTFPSFGLGMISESALQDVRQEFIYACTLHGLITPGSVDRLLGEAPFTPPPTQDKRLFKETLVQQCATEPGKAVHLIDELDKLDGNAGQIVAAVTEVIRDACSTKDTMTLKSICNALSKKTQLLDVFLQFTSPISILQPLCQLLDAWRYEEDQGEYQPVYDEFASIILLVLAFAYRFNLTPTELGIPTDSFVAKYLSNGHTSLVVNEITDEQSKHLESWIKGLFGADGITEEVTSSCRPQQFYMLVPTLFKQTLLACSEGHLTMGTVRNGLEYLLEPFLLPSLVGAILWVGAYLGEQSNSDLDVLLQMFQRVTQTPTSSDAQTMHSTILSIVSQPLLSQLKAIRHRHPGRKDVQSMVSTMQSHADFRRGPFSACPELHSWRKTPGSLRQAVRTTYQSLITWSVQCALNASQLPPPYHPRQFIIVEREIGAKALLSILIEELKAQTEHPNGAASVAFDIATAIICAPTTENSPIEVNWIQSPVPAPSPRHARRLNLRDALRIEYELVTDTIQKDHLEGETIVRLNRLVDAQLALSSVPMPDLSVSMPSMVHGLSMTSDVVAADGSQVIDFTQDANATLDLGDVADSMALESTLDSMLANPELNENDPDDIFGELDFGGMSADMDMDIDGMDMTF